MQAVVANDNLELLFVILAFVAFGLAIWRGTKRDVLGTCLLGGVGLVILLFAA